MKLSFNLDVRLLLVATFINGIRSQKVAELYIFDDEYDATIHSLTLTALPTLFADDNKFHVDVFYHTSSTEEKLLFDVISQLCDENDTRAAVISLSNHESCSLGEIFATSGVPLLTASLEHCHSTPSIRVRPEFTTYVEAALELFLDGDDTITQVGVIMDTSLGLDLYAIEQNFESRLAIDIFDFEEDEIDVIVNKLKSLHIRHVTIVGNSQAQQKVSASLRNITDINNFFWLFVSLDGLGCSSFYPDAKHVICMSHSLATPDNRASEFTSNVKLAYLYDAANILRNVLEAVSDDKSGNSVVMTKICPTSASEVRRTVMNYTEFLQSYTVPGLLGNNTFVGSSNVELFLEIREVTVDNSHQQKQHVVGSWNSITGLNLPSNPWKGVPPAALVVVSLPEPPFVVKTVGPNGTKWTGYTIDVLNEITGRLGLIYSIREPYDGLWGVQENDGSYSGIIGEVARSIADVGAGPISVTAERESILDFSTPYYDYAGIQILTGNVETQPSLFGFVAVFEWTVWICWASSLVVTAILIRIFDYFHTRQARINDVPDGEDKRFTIGQSIWFVIGSFTMAGADACPRCSASRILVAGFWFFCMIMMATYTGNLTAFLTVSRMETSVETLDDLAAQSNIQYSVVTKTAEESYFRRMAYIEKNFYTLWKEMSMSSNKQALTDFAVWDYPLGDKYQQIWDSMVSNGLLSSSEEGIAKVLQGNFAFMHETPLIKYEMSRVCGLTTIGSPFSRKPYAFALPQRSPLKEKFNNIILELQSETALEELKEKWWSNGEITCEETDEHSGLTLSSLGGIFYVLVGGILLGLLALSLEVLVTFIMKTQRLQAYLPR